MKINVILLSSIIMIKTLYPSDSISHDNHNCMQISTNIDEEAERYELEALIAEQNKILLQQDEQINQFYYPDHNIVQESESYNEAFYAAAIQKQKNKRGLWGIGLILKKPLLSYRKKRIQKNSKQ